MQRGFPHRRTDPIAAKRAQIPRGSRRHSLPEAGPAIGRGRWKVGCYGFAFVFFLNILNKIVIQRGASGQGLSAGYVAVHPGEIPYGTRMYITSADNSFVYGFAIAADTGLGLLGDVIDVDLYYDTYLESCLNGKRNVNIYLLD